jgi:hypothetical protein
MEDECGAFGNELVLPQTMLTAGVKGQGVAYLRDCLSCGASLASLHAIEVDDIDLQEWELTLLRNGRATLAALYDNEVWMTPDGPPRPLAKLGELDRRGVIPNKAGFLKRERALSRMVVRP